MSAICIARCSADFVETLFLATLSVESLSMGAKRMFEPSEVPCCGH